MKRILLPTDFSENAYNAIKYAMKFYQNEPCEFFLLHTYTPTFISGGNLINSYSALSLQLKVQELAQENLKSTRRRILKEFPNGNHTFNLRASFNTLISEMKEMVALHDIDLIIMGTQGATGAKEVFIGTNTMYTIKKITCPVIAVPANFEYETPKEILFPTDYKLNKDNKYLSLIREICKTHISRLHILNAIYGNPLNQDQQEMQAFLDEYFKGNAHLFHVAEDRDVLGAMEEFQLHTKINFIVMFHNKHSFLENMLFKPVINQIVFHTHVPFLVIPSVERQND